MNPNLMAGSSSARRDETERFGITIGHRRASVVLVGTGCMGKIRAKNLYSNPRFDLRGIVDIDFASAVNLANIYSPAKAFHSLDEAVQQLGIRYKKEPQLGVTEAPSPSFLPKEHDHPKEGCPDRSPLLRHSSWSSSSSQSFASCFAGEKESSSSQDPSNDNGLDAVIISTRTPTHASLIQQAAHYGLTIFVEKPLADTPEESERLFQLCEGTGSQICCGFQRRFDESYVEAAKMVQAGKIGRVVSANIFFGDHPCPPIDFLVSGGNIFSDLCVHDVDYIRWVLGEEVDSVFAAASYSSPKLKKCGVQDNATVTLQFQGGT